jgi:tetratricopeptide (TPR) repeat protein
MRKARLKGFVCAIIGCTVFCFSAVFAAEDPVRSERVQKAKEFHQAGQKLLLQGDYAAANKEFAKAEMILSNTVAPDAGSGDDVSPGPASSGTQPEAKSREPLVDSDTFYNLGIEALRKGEYGRAEQAFKQALALDPGDAQACYNLGVLYDNYLINKKEALKYYLRYVNTAPDAPDAEAVRSWVNELQLQERK